MKANPMSKYWSLQPARQQQQQQQAHACAWLLDFTHTDASFAVGIITCCMNSQWLLPVLLGHSAQGYA
jgi:hypothetical protein